MPLVNNCKILFLILAAVTHYSIVLQCIEPFIKCINKKKYDYKHGNKMRKMSVMSRAWD